MCLTILNLEPFELFHIYFLLKRTMQEGSFDIHLVKASSLRRSKGYDRTDGGISGNQCKYLIIVYSFLLREASSNKSELEILSTPISSMFDLVEPF